MALELKDKFTEAALKCQDLAASEDSTILLHRTPWVRILLELNKGESCSLSIEVEVSPPKNQRNEEIGSSESFDQLNQHLQHLQYIQRLREHGFELCVIGSGCIWCASKVVCETPKDNLFRALIPP